MAEAQLKPIGTVDKAAGAVSVRHPDGSTGILSKGSPVHQGDVIETGSDGRVGVVFVDKSTFSLGPKGRMAMDEMVYDPAHPAEGHSTIAAMHGAYSFVSGQIAKAHPEAMTIKTPVFTIGVRGTSGAGRAGPEGSDNSVTLLRDNDGALGEVSISNAGGRVVLNSETHTVRVSSYIMAPPKPNYLSAAEVREQYGHALDAQPVPPAPPPANPPPQQDSSKPQGGDSGAALDSAKFTGSADPGGPVSFIAAATWERLAKEQEEAEEAEEDEEVSLGELLADIGADTVEAADGAEQGLEEMLLELFADMAEFEEWLLALEEAGWFDFDKGWDFYDYWLEGTQYSDTIQGGDKGEHIYGYEDDDVLKGGGGDDYIEDGDGNDLVWGEDGDDYFLDGDGADDYDGGSGTDLLSFKDATGSVTVNLLTNTILDDGLGNTGTVINVEDLDGGYDDDTLRGDNQGNCITGQDGLDQIYGEGGDDILSGGRDNDMLDGGSGIDSYLFGDWWGSLSALGTDTISSFEAGERILLEDWTFGLGEGALSASRYAETSTLLSTVQNLGAAGQAGIVAVADSTNVRLYYCDDLSQAGAAGTSYQIATLTNTSLATISHANFEGV